MRHKQQPKQAISTFGEPPAGDFAQGEPEPFAHLAERSCTDCNAYAPAGDMITMPDSRVICRACYRAIKATGARKAQVRLFEQQESLF